MSLAKHGIVWYSFKMALLGLALRLPAAGVCALILAITGQSSIPVISQSREPLSAIVIAPLLETFIGQVLPVDAVALFSKNQVAQIIVSSAFFACLHALPQLAGVLGAVAVLGSCVAMSITYVSWRRRGFWPAYWATALVHAWTNALTLALVAIRG